MSSFLIKVHSRCNLMCDYCYEYNCGNTSWRSKPREMSWEVYEKTVSRVEEHAVKHGLDYIFFSFHGGEPLLRSPDFFRSATKHARNVLGARNIKIEFGMQSNATLLTEEMADTLAELQISIGISLDGPEPIHNEYRVYSTGESSYVDAVNGLRKLLDPQRRKIWGGFLTVINIKHDPTYIFDHLAEFDPPSMDFLEPHGAWNKLPAGKNTFDDTAYGDWLIRLFDYWYDTPRSRYPIRKFEEIIEHMFGGRGTLESFGIEPVNLMTIATDGAYETVDCIKAAHPAAEVLGLDVFNNSLDDVLSHPMIAARQTGLEALSETCVNCDLVHICGGGYFAHRYSPKTGFRNPTIYCADYKKLIRHIQAHVRQSLI